MTTEPTVSQESAIVEVEAENITVTEEKPAKDASVIQQETLALVEAIRTKAFVEAQKAGEFARDNYLEAVRKARQDIESRNLFDPDHVDDAIKQLQKEVEKDWDALVKEVTGFGDRLNEAAKAAWEVLTSPKSNGNE